MRLNGRCSVLFILTRDGRLRFLILSCRTFLGSGSGVSTIGAGSFLSETFLTCFFAVGFFLAAGGLVVVFLAAGFFVAAGFFLVGGIVRFFLVEMRMEKKPPPEGGR